MARSAQPSDVSITDENGTELVTDNRSAELFRRMLTRMESMAVVDSDSEYDGSDIADILGAETLEEMDAADERNTLNAQHLIGCELVLHGYSVKFSGREDITSPFIAPDTGKPMYVLVQATRISEAGKKLGLVLPNPGEEFTFNTSAPRVIAKLVWLGARGYYELSGDKKPKWTITGSQATNGTVLKLKLIPDRIFQG
jgi:hypothetical protein